MYSLRTRFIMQRSLSIFLKKNYFLNAAFCSRRFWMKMGKVNLMEGCCRTVAIRLFLECVWEISFSWYKQLVSVNFALQILCRCVCLCKWERDRETEVGGELLSEQLFTGNRRAGDGKSAGRAFGMVVHLWAPKTVRKDQPLLGLIQCGLVNWYSAHPAPQGQVIQYNDYILI